MIEFFLHGFGSNADVFRKIWADAPDGQVRFFLNGPEFDNFTSGRRWFPLSSHPITVTKGLELAADAAQRQIETKLRASGYTTNEPLALTGHSQGAMVSLELLCRRELNISLVNCYAGYMPHIPSRSVDTTDKDLTILNIFSSTVDHFIAHSEIISTYRYFCSIPGLDVRHYQSSRIDHAFSTEWLDPNNFVLQVEGNGH